MRTSQWRRKVSQGIIQSVSGASLTNLSGGASLRLKRVAYRGSGVVAILPVHGHTSATDGGTITNGMGGTL